LISFFGFVQASAVKPGILNLFLMPFPFTGPKMAQNILGLVKDKALVHCFMMLSRKRFSNAGFQNSCSNPN
jgi:hypothetical protein